ncbi:MAG: hypothetical protein GY832_41950 [Chloroflexi bacterium]|nr:hypothetical protein [Chloroflexota bacterium]
MNQERLRELLLDAMADCHDGEDAFCFFYTLAEGKLNFPLKARALGGLVEVVDLERFA